MSQNVEKLKALLFDEEAQARLTLERKVETLAFQDARGREELRQKIEQVFSRAGTRESFAASVSQVLDDALREAEIAQHDDLSRTIAPLVVTTIKTELRNSQDEMVEALYPITGRLVKSYVASAMKDLTEQINQRLEQNPIMLRLQSLTTGRPVSELALARTQDFQVLELYLIRRGSGDLVAYWPDVSPTKSRQSISGVLAAINEFANEALSASQDSMRQIDLGDELVYLRGSPLYLLAARCSGSAPPNIEQMLDDSFIEAIENQNFINQSGPQDAAAPSMQEFGESLSTKISAGIDAHRSNAAGGNPLKYLAAITILPLLAYFGWSWYGKFSEDRVRSAAVRIFESLPEMRGYPADLNVRNRGKQLIVSGLTPSQNAKTKVIRLLASELANTNILDELTVVAGGDTKPVDFMPEINRVRSEVSNAEAGLSLRERVNKLDRSRQKLVAAASDLKQMPVISKNSLLASQATKTAALLDALIADTKLEIIGSETSTGNHQHAATFAAFADRLEAMKWDVFPELSPNTNLNPAAATALSADPFERFVIASDRIASLAAAAAIASAYTPAPTVLPAPVKELTPREKLADYIQANAVFFANDLEYRDPSDATRVANELAPLIQQAGAFLRIVGYTDDSGIQQRNINLAQQRADKVRAELLSRGVSQSSIEAVGRADARDISSLRGADSPNRRVEFELGFNGEGRP